VGVKVRGDVADRIAASPSRFVLQVHAPDDLAAALAAMRLFRVDLVGLSGRGERPADAGGRGSEARHHADVSQPVPAPDGPLLLVQHLGAEATDLRRIPELLVRRLEEAGVADATVAAADLGGRLDVLDTTPSCVVLRLFPTPDGSTTAVPPDWLDVAVDWVVGDLRDDDLVTARILSVEHEVPAREAAAVLHDCGVARAWCDLVNGDPEDRIRTVSVTFGRLPHLALAAGGAGLDGPGLLARFALLQDVARELAADVAYAACSFEQTFEGLTLGLPVDGWRARGGAPPNRVAASVCDVVVPDAYPWQVLGPGHLHRLDQLGEEPPPYEQLGDGRIEVALGDPADWLPRSHARIDAQEDAIAWLSPLLLDEAELAALEAARPSPARRRPESPTSPFTRVKALPTTPHGMPDLDSITLRTTPSARRSTRLTPLELAAWLAHEPHSDEPATVSPVLATFVRWWARGLGEDGCQQLKATVPAFLGTAGDAGAERIRRWLALDWLVRSQAACWLRLAGLVEAAEKLAALGELTDEAELAKAVEVLGSAITVASRRIDITASIVAGDDAGDDPDELLAWEAWEAVTEPTAWVAASEAATQGIPSEIAYATDLRVIECSRNPAERDRLAATGTPVGATAWTTALHAIADEAWERGWRAADLAAREASGLTIRIEMGRVAKTTLLRGGAIAVGEEGPEVALEQAEAAAKEVLVRAALRGGEPDRDGEHPWDEARNAARASFGGAVWSVVVDESRAAVGEAGWAQAMAEARDAVDELLGEAPDAVARAVAAASAREACSAAARGVARRAAAVARANGADDDGAVDATRNALAPAVTTLHTGARSLLDALVAGRWRG
jgi:hypothetical protein